MGKGDKFTDKLIKSLKSAEKECWIREGQGFCSFAGKISSVM
jgi:hypothetical protein